MVDNEYWSKRSEERVSKIWKDEKKYEKELANQYKKSVKKIRSMIADLYLTYSKDSNLTYDDLVKDLNSYEITNYKEQLKTLEAEILRTGNEEAIRELNKLKNVSKLTRLQALMTQIEGELLMLGVEKEYTMGEYLKRVYEKNYYQTIFQMHQGLGIGTSFVLLNQDKIKTAITIPWSGDNYSSRLWSDKRKLADILRQTITQGTIRGDSVQKMAYGIAKRMDANYSNALRLVRTETAFVIGESTARGYSDNGIVKQYKYIAILDDRTSKTCESLDGKIFNVSDRKPGVNASPMHPNCRSTEAPYFSKSLEETMEEYRKSKKVEKLPKKMTYEQWFKKYGVRG